METKKCIECGELKSISDFYIHSKMKDGHLNSCKECKKKYAIIKFKKNMQNEEFVDKERNRNIIRSKNRRIKKNGTDKKIISNWGSYINGETKRNYLIITKRIRRHNSIPEGFVIHHWNYNDLNNVFLVTKRLHFKIHGSHFVDNKKCSLNLNDFLYFVYGENELNTKEKHYEFILKVIENNNFFVDECVSITFKIK